MNKQLEFYFVEELFLQPINFDFIENMSLYEVMIKMSYDYYKYSGMFMKIIFPPYQLMLSLEFDGDI